MSDPPVVPGASRAPPAPPGAGLRCRDCPMWYGAEDDGWGPCSIKNRRGDERYLTWGGHACDEGYVPPDPSPSVDLAAALRGARSTSRASAVGYRSTSNAGKRRRPAARRRRVGSSSSRRRTGSSR